MAKAIGFILVIAVFGGIGYQMATSAIHSVKVGQDRIESRIGSW